MKTHELKTWPVFYKSIIDGTKTFEVRQNDRDFQLGDILLLREYDPDAEQYTGAKTERVITYILGDNPFFQLNAMVILGISPLPQQESERSAEEFAEKRWQESQGEFSVTNFMEGFKYASQFKLLPVPSVTVTDEEIEITQKCRQCGNEWSKELHCRECGNNFPFYPEDNNNIHFNSSIPDAQIETEARRMITEDPLRAYNLDFALSLARRVNKQYEK